MTRPLRVEYPGATYHITSRGNARENIFKTVEDRQEFLNILENTVRRYNWTCYAYCLMSNHYHLLIQTPEGNLSRGMRYLNGVYTQKYNSVNKHIGHVFQGRYKAILVEKESYLLELIRYILNNPVRANIVKKPNEWKWSSYKYIAGIKDVPAWMNVSEIYKRFGSDRNKAIRKIREFISGHTANNIREQIKGQIYLGSDKFVKKLSKEKIEKEIPVKQQRLKQKPLKIILRESGKELEIYSAYVEHGYKMREIAEHLGIHYATVSRRIKKYEQNVLHCKT